MVRVFLSHVQDVICCDYVNHSISGGGDNNCEVYYLNIICFETFNKEGFVKYLNSKVDHDFHSRCVRHEESSQESKQRKKKQTNKQKHENTLSAI